MDIKAKLASKSKNTIEVKSETSVEKKLKKKDLIAEHLKLQKEYVEEDIIISKDFLQSVTLHKNMFTNKVNPEPRVNHINEHIIENLNLILNDPLSLTKKTSQIELNTSNRNRLKSILSKYDKDTIEEEGIEGINLFKVSGKRTRVKIGKKVEDMNAFRVYLKIIEINEKNSYKLLFIDPYHLAIPSDHDGKPAKTVREQKFNQYKYCQAHISVFLSEI